VRAVASIVVLLGACGRIGFDPAGDSGSRDTAASYVATVLADRPVVYYRLDEPGGVVAADSSGNGFDGTYNRSGSGQITYAQPGALARDPDAAAGMLVTDVPGTTASASVDLPQSAFAVAGDFTIEGWVMPTVPGGDYNDALFGWDDFPTSGVRCGWTVRLEPIVWTYEDGAAMPNRVESSGPPMVAGVWNHLVFERIGATASIYLDGQLVASGPLDYIVPPATGVGFFGADSGIPGGARYDEVALYDHALSAASVAAHDAAARSVLRCARASKNRAGPHASNLGRRRLHI
jgi:hypothetical protein